VVSSVFRNRWVRAVNPSYARESEGGLSSFGSGFRLSFSLGDVSGTARRRGLERVVIADGGVGSRGGGSRVQSNTTRDRLSVHGGVCLIVAGNCRAGRRRRTIVTAASEQALPNPVQPGRGEVGCLVSVGVVLLEQRGVPGRERVSGRGTGSVSERGCNTAGEDGRELPALGALHRVVEVHYFSSGMGVGRTGRSAPSTGAASGGVKVSYTRTTGVAAGGGAGRGMGVSSGMLLGLSESD
jgi:hypothetical protein